MKPRPAAWYYSLVLFSDLVYFYDRCLYWGVTCSSVLKCSVSTVTQPTLLSILNGLNSPCWVIFSFLCERIKMWGMLMNLWFLLWQKRQQIESLGNCQFVSNLFPLLSVIQVCKGFKVQSHSDPNNSQNALPSKTAWQSTTANQCVSVFQIYCSLILTPPFYIRNITQTRKSSQVYIAAQERRGLFLLIGLANQTMSQPNVQNLCKNCSRQQRSISLLQSGSVFLCCIHKLCKK